MHCNILNLLGLNFYFCAFLRLYQGYLNKIFCVLIAKPYKIDIFPLFCPVGVQIFGTLSQMHEETVKSFLKSAILTPKWVV